MPIFRFMKTPLFRTCSMPINNFNPFSGEITSSFEFESAAIVESKILTSNKAFKYWKTFEIADRRSLFLRFAQVLRENSASLAEEITRQMGKILAESKAEIEKCATVAEYYAQKTKEILVPKQVSENHPKTWYSFEPQGTIFAIMPWNFPFWQALRFAIPTLLAGNVVLLKHAPNTWKSAALLEELFLKAGFPEGAFQSLYIDIDLVEKVIAHPFVKGVTLTGSNLAGASVASLAGKYLKKSVLELGGSDPFVVLKDADLEKAAMWAVKSRFQNAGQTCIAAKRWIVVSEVANEFIELTTRHIQQIRYGDPMSAKTQMGPLARPDLADKLEKQVETLVKMGAEVIIPGKRTGNMFSPAFLKISREISANFTEELFGPVACVIVANDENEAIEIANETNFGLGASLWTSDLKKAEKLAEKIEAGSVFVNAMVKSDPSLPFGGINASGYGRELGVYGLTEFLNIKSYYFENPG